MRIDLLGRPAEAKRQACFARGSEESPFIGFPIQATDVTIASFLTLLFLDLPFL